MYVWYLVKIFHWCCSEQRVPGHLQNKYINIVTTCMYVLYVLYVCMYVWGDTFASFDQPHYKRLVKLSYVRNISCLPIRAVDIRTANIMYVCMCIISCSCSDFMCWLLLRYLRTRICLHVCMYVCQNVRVTWECWSWPWRLVSYWVTSSCVHSADAPTLYRAGRTSSPAQTRTLSAVNIHAHTYTYMQI